MLVGSVVNGLNSSGGFCSGSHIVVDHLRIDGTSFTFSAAVVALLAVSASEGINIPRNTVSDAVHPVKHLTGPSGPYWTASRRRRSRFPRFLRTPPRRYPHHFHIHLRSPVQSSSAVTLMAPNLLTPAWPEPPSFNIAGEGAALHDIMDRGARAVRVGHTCVPPSRAGTRRGAAERPPRCSSCAVAQGVRARGHRLEAVVTKVLAQWK